MSDTDLQPAYREGAWFEHDHHLGVDYCFACKLAARFTDGVVYDDFLSDEDTLFRTLLERVFHLEPGEMTGPFSTLPEPYQWFRFWYSGPPSYIESEFPQEKVWSDMYLTALMDLTFTPKVEDPPGYRLVRILRSSGECECDCRWEPENNDTPDPACPLCDGDGFIYIGDGWAEVVFEQLKTWLTDDEREEIIAHIITETVRYGTKSPHFSASYMNAELFETLRFGWGFGSFDDLDDARLWKLAVEDYAFKSLRICFDPPTKED